MKNKVYAAGIVDHRGDWIWQGTVVAATLTEGKRLLASFKRRNDIAGRCEVTSFGPANVTRRPVGVSNSTNLF